MRHLALLASFVVLAAACGSSGTGGSGGGAGTGGSGTGGSAGSGTGGGSGGGTGGSAGSGTGGGSGGGTGGGAPYTLATFCTDEANARCTRAQRCLTLDSTELSLCKVRATADCLATAAVLDAGVVKLDLSAGMRCVSDLNAYPCTQGGVPVPPSCAAVITANGQPGSPCSTYLIVGNALIPDTCTQGYCPYKQNTCLACTAYRTVGQACVHNLFGGALACDPTTGYCPIDDGGTRQCQAFAAAGSTCVQFSFDDSPCRDACNQRGDGGFRCGFNALGEKCRAPTACGPAAYCKGLWMSTGIAPSALRDGVCTARLALNAACTNETYADDGCSDAGTCLDSVCKPVPFFSRNMGQECDFAGECVDTAFCKDLYDSPPDGGARAGSCSGRLTVGTSCTAEPGSGIDPCAQGAKCPLSFGTPGMCQGLRSIAQVCGGVNDTCKETLDCWRRDGGLGNTGVCRRPADAGEDCAGIQGATCRSEANPAYTCLTDGGFNANGTCAAPLADGSGCVSAADCRSGRCFSPDGGAALKCQPACF